MKTADFDFNIDSRVMPHDPVELRGKKREEGRMIVLDRSNDRIDHAGFGDIVDYLRPDDLLVLNDSYMLSNTLQFEHDGKLFLATLYGHLPDSTSVGYLTSEQQVPIAPGLKVTSSDDPNLTCTVVEKQPDGNLKLQFEPAELLIPTLDKYGWRRDDTIHLDGKAWQQTPEAYRSVYSKKPGSLDIPSAGLHFSRELLARIAAKGVETAYITLHVGVTETFAIRHISQEEIENHKVNSEQFEVSAEAAEKINRARAEGRRIVGVGTTVMRTLESLMVGKDRKSEIEAKASWTDLYIYPGFDFKIIDVLLTNLHRPRSSHIVLTAAFAGKDFVMRSYEDILKHGGYEFDMFGDCMLII